MKLSVKVKVLMYLAERIKSVPEGKKTPEWLLLLSKVAVLIFSLPTKVKSWRVVSFVKNIYIIYFTDKSRAVVFSGWGYRWFAKKYADKRSEISKVNELCGGKRHYVIEFDDRSMIVMNRIEMNNLKLKHLLPRKYNVLDVFTHAFYVTK